MQRTFIAGADCDEGSISLMGGKGNFVATMFWDVDATTEHPNGGEVYVDTEPIWYDYLVTHAFEEEPFLLQHGEGWRLEAEMCEVFVQLRFIADGRKPIELSVANDLLLARLESD